MPKLKVDRIVSFSSEDSNHSAGNVLLSDTTKKWKCQSPGEKAANLVLQLDEASIITGIDIGNENSAYVEVLVARSGSNDDFAVLLVMSSFMTPLEARQSTNINKVRMFGYNDLQSPERDQKWDRIKIVCTQPFNRHVQFGLSFITLHSQEKDSHSDTIKLGNFSLRPTSPDNLSAGSLFARRKELGKETPLSAAIAIRTASTTLAANGSPKIKEKLKGLKQTSTKTPIRNTTASTSDSGKERNRNELLYDDDDEAPNAKIDQLIEKKNKEAEEKQSKEKSEKEEKRKKEGKIKNQKRESKETPSASKNQGASTSKGTSDTGKRKMQEELEANKKIKTNPTKLFNKLLEGVTIVISGIQNPERATIRTNALEMGAKYKADWDTACTHLICAFTNTPKFKQVQGKGKIVNRLWVSDCHNQRKRLPWRRYALDSTDQNKPESEDEVWEEKSNAPDVQLVYLREANESSDSENNDLQISTSTSRIEAYNLDTDEEDYEALKGNNNEKFTPLLEFFDGKVFYVDQYLKDDEKQLLTRYITAYKGLLLEEPSDIVDFVITSSDYADVLKGLCPIAEMVSPNWIWDCHNCQKLVSHQKYSF